MTDRELLELAAKAAGFDDAKFQDMSGWGEVRYGLSRAIWSEKHGEYWNPLDDDGDALRLAVSLQIGIDWHRQACVDKLACPRWYTAANQYGDVNAATRLAIVRAAAQIARKAS